MAICKFLSAKSPVKNALNYITNVEKTNEKLITGINCIAENAEQEFLFTKRQFNKIDGRQYYHIIQSFSPDDDITFRKAHEIGKKFAEYFGDYQAVVATHFDRNHVHNHIILNSVNFKNGKKFHQTAKEMEQAKAFSNSLCMMEGFVTTEVKSRTSYIPKWKKELKNILSLAIKNTTSKHEFIRFMNRKGYIVDWKDNHKHITFTTPDNHKCRDNKLFDERFLKENLEKYFEFGGAESNIAHEYQNYMPYVLNAIADISKGIENVSEAKAIYRS